ncbi:helix-turn-helix domain-containing protein [Brachyspira hampsonii]|uniref:Transcriptional regulator n=1 Tax=Brachyspira hampsonii TaxID=1287055 RepID=A0AAC9TWF4_9SPIR|nr:helix-turn-helix transcriptional regulator [Brachyspira hampsonii]ASJ22202.1 transcriptional regulator [Brachyspira hampsonii]ELV07010.1 MerR family transcriptional regulator [Brachyspira hampsonii 30599]MBW5379474.1 XRE family transcriptional regulator [Brachyspira hampsonii]OEJ19098.1 MerR family transcriptional regulator [Brachyspira hampsonii]
MNTEPVLKNLGQNIRELRKNKKMTIDELAEQSSLSGKYLQGVEVGNRNISIKNLNKICKALETSPDILLNIKIYYLKSSEEKIFAISEKLKKFEKNKLDFIGDIIDQLNNIMKNEEKNK